MPTLTSTRLVRFVLAPLLSIWVAGGGCLLGCQGTMASAATVQNSSQEQHSGHHSEQKATKVATGQACSSTGSHGCCSKKAGAKSTSQRVSNSNTALDMVGGSSSGMMKGCPLAIGKAALPVKLRDNEFAAAPVVIHSILPADNVLERISALSPPARLANRGHTYLRCCVFLI